MFFEFVAAIVAGFLGAGLALVANRLSGGRLPRWIMPVAAGAAMIAYTIWSEYTWFDRTVAQLPDDMEVTLVNEASALYRPWTYVAPLKDRFAALDHASMQTNPEVPDQRIATMFFFGRWSPVRSVPMIFDCARGRQAPLATVTFDDKGAASAALWSAPDAENPAIAAACKEV